MISAIGNRWAIRGPHQSLLLSLLAFRYSAIRFNMLSSFFYCMFPPPSFSCNVDYSADDNNRTFKNLNANSRISSFFLYVTLLKFKPLAQKQLQWIFWSSFFFWVPLNSTFGLAALSGSMLIHAFVSACLFKSVR